MTLTLEQLTTLAGLAMVPAFVSVAWIRIVQRDVKTGRRVRLRLRDLSRIRKFYVVGLASYFVFVLYSDLTTIISIETGTGLPFLTVLQAAVVSIWLGAAGLLGIGLLYAIRSPLRKATF